MIKLGKQINNANWYKRDDNKNQYPSIAIQQGGPRPLPIHIGSSLFPQSCALESFPRVALSFLPGKEVFAFPKTQTLYVQAKYKVDWVLVPIDKVFFFFKTRVKVHKKINFEIYVKHFLKYIIDIYFKILKIVYYYICSYI